MASGHVNRTQRPNTWLHRPSLRREASPCQPGAVHTWPTATDIVPQQSVGLWGQTGSDGRTPEMTLMTRHGSGVCIAAVGVNWLITSLTATQLVGCLEQRRQPARWRFDGHSRFDRHPGRYRLKRLRRIIQKDLDRNMPSA